VFDECGSNTCALNAHLPQKLELVREVAKEKLALFEREHRYATKQQAKVNEIKKKDRLVEFRSEVIKRADLLNTVGLRLQVIDLTLSKEKILEGYLVKVDKADVPPEDDDIGCMICWESLEDGPLDANGQIVKPPIKGLGIVRKLPSCKCHFHLECLIKNLVEIPSLEGDAGDRCPACRTDTRCRFGVFNGVEETILRHSRNPMPGRYVVGGFLDLKQTISLRRQHYMKVIPFRPVEDRFGNLPSRT
jgi:hypothetical protein